MIFFPATLRSTVITRLLRFAHPCGAANGWRSRCARLVATMMALTAASRLATFLRWQLSCVHGIILAWHTTTNHLNILHDRFRISRRGPVRGRTRASPLTSRLAVLLWPNRVHSRCRLSGSFRCSPPRLAATQLLQVLTRNTVPDGRGLPPRRIVTLHSALVLTLRVRGLKGIITRSGMATFLPAQTAGSLPPPTVDPARYATLSANFPASSAFLCDIGGSTFSAKSATLQTMAG